jgi:hypothetical protein
MKEKEPQSIVSYKISCYDCTFSFTARLSEEAVTAEERVKFLQDVADGHEHYTGHETYKELVVD